MDIVIVINVKVMNAKNNAQKVCHIVQYYNDILAPAFDPNSCGYSVYDNNGKWLEGVYTRVHRDPVLINAMRRWLGLSSIKDFSLLGLPEKCYLSYQFEEFLG